MLNLSSFFFSLKQLRNKFKIPGQFAASLQCLSLRRAARSPPLLYTPSRPAPARAAPPAHRTPAESRGQRSAARYPTRREPRVRVRGASPRLQCRPPAERALHAGALASPTHTGEGAEGRREGGEKVAEEGDGRKKIRQRERRGREMRGGATAT
ncbi:hypothetical protein PVAP13_1KG156205 [Panicum virgatum]|uniref:Uncharacterized protein n=1 Tax=Panicum virgatum TaxID=38727 RepID=A0A8T0XKQ4_PANVG|nr:hypothetical protein PVAP13_1KG156205 [Panicum virgatum]